MIRLVVNAQELGTARDSDVAIMNAHRDGVVTSTSVSGNCVDLASARDALREAPRLGTGLSLALIGGAPIAPAKEVSSLLTPAGMLRGSAAEFAVDWVKGAISPVEVEHELIAQVTRARDAGWEIDHLCTRGHLGFLPGVGQMVERVARRFHVNGIRSTVEPPTLSWFMDPGRGAHTGLLAGLSWLTRRRLGPLRHGPKTWGYLESGRLDEVRIVELIGRMGPGSHELICHPGSAGDGELRALTSNKVKTALAGRGIVLCRWQDLF